MPLAEARKKMGPYADALALDQIVRSPRARALGWTPSLHSVAGNAARLFEEWRRGKEALPDTYRVAIAAAERIIVMRGDTRAASAAAPLRLHRVEPQIERQREVLLA